MSQPSSIDGEASNESDEIRRKLLKPKVSADEALSLLIDFYVPDGFEKSDIPRAEVLRQLDSYDDVNFLVKLDGQKALLKIHNGVESEQYIAAHLSKALKVDESDTPRSTNNENNQAGTSIIDLHTAIFEHLSLSSKPNITSAPATIPPSEKQDDVVSIRELPVHSPDHSPAQLVIRLQSWVEGRPLSAIQRCPIETLVDAGCVLGQLAMALDELGETSPTALKASTRYHAWDGRNFLDIQSYVAQIDSAEQRNMVTSVLETFRTDIVEGNEGSKFRMGINHGDFNDANIIVDDQLKVRGCIDFGDTVYSWRVLDVSVAMTYAMLSSYGKNDRSISAACAVLRGFNSVYALTAQERRHLRLLVACRLATSATLGNFSYKQNPGNEYLLLHAKPAWKALEFIWGSGHSALSKAIDKAFEIACSSTLDGTSVPEFTDLAFPDPQIHDLVGHVRAKTISSKIASSTTVVTFVTGNKKKAEEVKRILSGGGALPFDLTNQKIDLPELQGDPHEVAKAKCSQAASAVNGPVMTEDTSLCFHALGDLPGIYIRWFLEKCGLDGLNDMVAASADKSAYAQTIFAYTAGPGSEVHLFDGRTQGKIVRPRGCRDFGWDPIFEPDQGGGLTYAEMTGEEKDEISHRKRALVKLKDFFEKTFGHV